MLCMYMGGVVTCWISLEREGDHLEFLTIHSHCIDGAHVSYIVCYVCTWGGAMTLLDVPSGGNRVVKEF